MMHKNPKIVVINPGSTSTKIAVYEGWNLVYKETLRHSDQDLFRFSSVIAQLEYRVEKIKECLHRQEMTMEEMDAVVGRGGFLKPIVSGTYRVDEAMLDDLKDARYGEHASNLGAVIADYLARPQGIPAFTVDPVVVDELEDLARLSGVPEIERKSQFHALNSKAVSRKVAQQLGMRIEESNFVVAHLGGGISVVAQHKGRIIDVNNANNEGPFSPERAGTLPVCQLVQLCFSGQYTEKEMLAKLTRESGLYGYLGTKDAQEVERRIEQGDLQAKTVLDGMIYQIAKEIGAMSAAMNGKVDGIIFTGGLSHSSYIVGGVSKKVEFIAPIYIVPGEEELEALAYGALRVLLGEETVKNYSEIALLKESI